MATGNKGVEKARKFLWDDDDDDSNLKARGSSAGGARTFSTRDYAVDQSVNLMAMGDVSPAAGADQPGGSGFAAGLFRGSASGSMQSTSLSRFDEYGDAAPSTESEEYIGNDKHRRRMSPFLAAITNACMGCVDSCVLLCGRMGPKGLACICFGIIGLILLLAGASMTMSHDDTEDVITIESVLVDAGIIDEVRFFEFESPHKKALDWITKDDPAKLTPTSPGLVERYILAVLWFGSNSRHLTWVQSDNWMTGAGYCSWFGIECVPNDEGQESYDGNGQILAIKLPSNGIEGTIPPCVFGLSNLITLDLSENSISGEVEPKLFDIPNLRNLILRKNQLVGTVPDEINNVKSKLHELNLGENQLEGTIPATMNDMTELRSFSVSQNVMTGTLPDLKSLTKLVHFYVDDNDFSGTLAPYFMFLTNLMELRMNNNKFSGTIRTAFHQLKNLEILHLHENQFSGRLDQNIFDFLTRITELRINNNQFTGTIPRSVTHLAGLRKLILHSNSFFGPIPPNMNLMVDVDTITMSNNQLTGTIHTSIGALDDLQVLSFDNNLLTGPIPSQLGNCFRLKELNLQNNKLTGDIPTSFENLNDLVEMHLEGNLFVKWATVPPQVCSFDDLESITVPCGEEHKVSCSCCVCVE